jgi:murein DD-endopeptidase MepM/ murein hydrolase activator NlpD
MPAIRTHAAHRWVAVATAVAAVIAVVALPGAAAASPTSPDRPAQEESPSGDGASTTAPVMGDDVLVADDSEALTGAIDEVRAEIASQVEKFETAQAALDDAIDALADADTAVSQTELHIEELTALSDEAVVDAFVNPPAEDAIATLASDNAGDATVRAAVLELQADADAEVLAELAAARDEYRETQAAQQAAREDAEAARADAEAALDDLQDAMGRQSQFMVAMTAGLDAQSAEALRLALSDPALAAQIAERRDAIAAELTELEDAREYAAALEALAEARERERLAAEAAAQQTSGGGASAPPTVVSSGGGIVCPVAGPVSFTDTWGAARSGGRTHQGVDILAAMGTPTVAPVSGRVEHRGSSLGGLSWYVYGDNGDMFYGTHLSGYANQGVGWVAAGTVIGYVGDSGNAAGTPHLHFEYHPGGGGAVNPYPITSAAC